jgi:GNAT superfamily N-acetyltransferase
MQLLRVTDFNSRLFVDSMAILRDSISAATQLPQHQFNQLLAGGSYQLFAYGNGDGAKGAALVYFSEQLPFAWLDYFAIRSDLRGKRLGSTLFREIVGLAAKRHPALDWVLLESDDDREGDAQHQATCARRIAFYRRLGARLLENVPYRFPSAFGPPMPMRLMVYGLRPNVTLSADDLKRAVADIFLNVHGRGEDDELLRWFHTNLPDEIEMK